MLNVRNVQCTSPTMIYDDWDLALHAEIFHSLWEADDCDSTSHRVLMVVSHDRDSTSHLVLMVVSLDRDSTSHRVLKVVFT